MSAEKARFIRRVWNDRGEVTAQVKENDGQFVELPVTELKRPELIRAASLVGAKAPRGKWAELHNEEIISRISRRVAEGHELRKPGHRDAGNNPDGGGQQGQGEWDIQNMGGPKVQGNGAKGGNGAEGDGDNYDGEVVDEEGNAAGEGAGEGEGGEMNEAGDDQNGEPFEPEPFTPDPKDVPESGDSIEEQIEKLKRQAEAQEAHEAKQEELRKQFEAAKQAEAEELRKQQEAEAAKAKEAEQEGEQAKKDRKAAAKQAKKQLPEKHHKVLPKLLDVLAAKQHCYLVGPPGTGKSFMAEQAAEILGREYGAMSCGPQTPESRLWGYMDAHGNYVETTFRRLYGSGNSIFNFDEVDNGHTGINTTVNQSLAGTGANFPDGWVEMGDGFSALATANTWGQGATAEHMGRNPQDEAFLDRFTFLKVDIDPDVEWQMVLGTGLPKDKATKWLETIHQLRANAEESRLKVVISPRASQKGAELMTLGWTKAEVMDARILKGLTDDRRARLTRGIR